MTDLTYTTDSLFTAFIPHTPDGENAWRVMAQDTKGTGKVLNMHAKAVISQLRKAGYTVSKAKAGKVSLAEIDELLGQLGE